MHRLVPAALACLTLAACSKEQPTAAAPESPAWLLAQAPADARTVGEIKPGASEGDAVTVRGRIGGSLKPITPGAAVFLIVDPAVPSCDQIPDDPCPTPWDYCCEPRENLAANTATVQLVAPDGSPLTADLAAAGLSPLDEVIITGAVAPRPNPQVLTIHATAIHKVNN